MTSAASEDSQTDAAKPTGLVRVLQNTGAVLIAAFALWFLFGIPAYLLFGIFFD